MSDPVRRDARGVRVDDLPVLQRQPVDVPPSLDLVRDHPEQVVEGVVLHHQHHDVLDLLEARRRMAGRQMRERS